MKGYDIMNNGKKLEIEFIKNLNNHYCKELNPNLQKFVTSIFNNLNNENKIYCKKLNNHEKADISIAIENKTRYISLKTGSQNSVHVEKIENFIQFLLDQGVSSKIINYLLIYHYGDDTLNGSGNKRYSAEEAKQKYKKQITEFNNYINYSKHLSSILERILFTGAKKCNKRVDFIYYGNIDIGTWCSSDELLSFCQKHKSMYMNTPHFSFFTYQNWCRNITFSKKSESHRNYIQIKWFSILSDINKIRSLNK